MQEKCTWRFVSIGRAASNCLLSVTALCLMGTPAARAQGEEQKGIDQGNYNIKQSIEFGGRFTDISGNSQTYDTFVNLQQGPRLLGFTMEMRSLDHHATLFDRLYFNNFGYGGDPNSVSRLRISKNRWYNFDALFRKDQNSWDYSLQANPLNPTFPFANGPTGFAAPTCTACVLNFSPHLLDTRRKLGDYNLLLFPESKVRFRAGYSRNTAEGPGFSTIHQGTEELLLQDVKTTVNTYRLGVDLKLLPRTNISYDQIWNHFKDDSGAVDSLNPLTSFPLSNGQLADLGVSYNSGANQPCRNTFNGPPPGAVSPACSAYLSYLSQGRTRTNTPTEQISVQSSYWKDWDLSARVSYSGGDTNVFGYDETFVGLESRTRLRNDILTGPVHGRRVAGAADFGATWRITDKLSFLDSFHYSNWHNPAAFTAGDCAFFSPSLLAPANVFTTTAAVPQTCAPTAVSNAPGLAPVQHAAGQFGGSSASSPDISVILNSNFLKQDEKTNLAELEYQFTKRVSGRLGYRHRHRAIADNFFASTNEIFFPNNAARGDCSLVDPTKPLGQSNLPQGCTLNADGSISFVTPAQTSSPIQPTYINEEAAVIGIWARPTDNLRFSFDAELMSADNAFTRISPRHTAEYRFRGNYKPIDWLTINASINLWESRNNVPQISNLQHNHAYGLSAVLQPTEKYGLEIGYDYNDVFSQILVCFTSSAAPTGLAQCPNVAGLVQQLSVYTNRSNYGYFDFFTTPFRNLSARLGANLTGTSGSALLLNPNAVPGSLDSKWLHPFGGLDYRFAKNWTGKAYWDFYGYHEDPTAGAVQDIFAPRNFRGNLITLSVRYAF